jgi:hypothetical protein
MGGASMSGPEVEDGIVTHLRSALGKENEAAKAVSARARKGIRILQKSPDPHDLKYRVVLTSLWAAEGEESVTMDRKGPIADLMHDAIEQFLRINKRSDVQARYDVYVILESRGKAVVAVQLPETFWGQYKWKAPERR